MPPVVEGVYGRRYLQYGDHVSLFLQTGSWSSPPTVVATRFQERLRGLRPRSDGRALLLKGSSVHSIGMQESLWVIGMDQAGTVIDIRFLRPGGVTILSGACWLLELPAMTMPPPVGSTLQPVVA